MSRIRPLLVPILLLATLLIGAVLLPPIPTGTEKEIAELKSVSWTQQEYNDYFVRLAEKKGPPYAFEVLKYAKIAFGVDTHRIGHEIGYVLYREQGVSGLGLCSDRYTAACAHAIVTQEYIHEGQNALARLTDTCLLKTEDSLGYWDCFHGIGHGIVAYIGYDLKGGIEECKALGRDVAGRDGETSKALLACVDGAVMEFFQGKHDPEVWKAQLTKQLPASDLLVPCSASYMPEAARTTCYSYIRARLLHKVGLKAKDHLLAPEKYTEAFSYCDRIPQTEPDNRRACYGGFGVHFGYLVNGSDDRTFPHMSDDQFRRLHELCGYTPHTEARSACTSTVATMVFFEGKGVERAVEFCRQAPDPSLPERCYSALLAYTFESREASNHRSALCAAVPESNRKGCF